MQSSNVRTRWNGVGNMFHRYEYEYVLDFLATLKLEGHDVEVLSSAYLTNMIWISFSLQYSDSGTLIFSLKKNRFGFGLSVSDFDKSSLVAVSSPPPAITDDISGVKELLEEVRKRLPDPR